MDNDSRNALHDLVARFANSLDLKDWDGLAACLDDPIRTDYSDLRGTPPETVSREAFVAFRQAGLSVRDTHHLAGNILVVPLEDGASVTASMLVSIREPDGQRTTVHCVYFLKVRRQDSHWRIHDIRQRILMK